MFKYAFEPKEDITVYELAIIVGAVSFGSQALKYGITVDETTPSWIELSENVKRHFRKIDVKA